MTERQSIVAPDVSYAITDPSDPLYVHPGNAPYQYVPSTLAQIIRGYLGHQGFHQTPNGLWGHPELGEGRTFHQVVEWQIGRERARAGAQMTAT